MSRLRIPLLLQLLYNHNPFYLISAGLFVYGLKLFHKPFEVEYMEPWSLMGSFCGVTAVMALTALGIVRLGKVWEDARSLILVLLMMFLSISVSFDEIVTLVSWENSSAGNAMSLLAFGLCFSIGITEVLLRGLKIQLPWVCRLPFYGMLTLFFGYPLFVSPEVSQISIEQARWRVALFPSCAALLTLSLLPAVRRGSHSYATNGTPWSWPWFPWSVFVFLGLAVCFRSYSLAISFDLASVRAHYWDTSFGLYFLVPFLLAVMALLLEIGLVENKPRLQLAVLWMGPILMLLARPWLTSKSWHHTRDLFLREFTLEVASPVFLTVCGLMLLYGYARLRRVRHAESALFGSLLLAMFLPPHSSSVRFDDPQIWPLGILALLETVSGIMRRQSVRTMSGAGCTAAVVGLLLWQHDLRTLAFPVAWHLGLFALLVIGLVFRDRHAALLRQLTAGLLSLSVAVAMLMPGRAFLHPLILPSYAAVLTIMSLLIAAFRRDAAFVASTAGCGLSALLRCLFELCRALMHIAGAVPLLCGTVCFLTAIGISVLKSGLGRRIGERWLPVSEPTSESEQLLS